MKKNTNIQVGYKKLQVQVPTILLQLAEETQPILPRWFMFAS